MEKEKRENYRNQMTANGIHTISANLPGHVKTLPDGVKDNIRRKSYDDEKDQTYLLINCNKGRPGGGLITQYSIFMAILEGIVRCLGYQLADLDVTRVDFAFNSRDLSSFQNYAKLHNLLVCCIAASNKMRNHYHTLNGNGTDLNFAAKNNYYEIENYDKLAESRGLQAFCNRLELRCKRMTGSGFGESFLTRWIPRLKAAKDSFDTVCQQYNHDLVQLYFEDMQRDKRDRYYRSSVSCFLWTNRDVIFCRKQLIDLLNLVEVKNPVKTADRFKETHKIECFSKTDIQIITQILCDKLNEYFDS